MRAIVLGLPGSGTSYITSVMREAGWKVPCPYVASRSYPTHEILWLREVNERALRGWRPSRFSPRARVDGSKERVIDARIAIQKADARCARWVFKNPESVVTWEKIWSRFRWDLIVGVYRHPIGTIDSIHRDHLPESVHERPSCDLELAWSHWNERILDVADVLVRFPDASGLARRLGLARTPDPLDDLITNAVDGPVPAWSQNLWVRLEGARCASTTAART